MKIYCVALPYNQPLVDVVRDAAEGLGVECIHLDPLRFDYTAGLQLARGDALLRLSPKWRSNWSAHALEQVLLQKDVATIYRSFERAQVSYPDSFFVHAKAGVQIAKTIPHLTTDRSLLRRYVDSLGGLPVVIKVLGGTKGVGVMRVDSYAGLYSLVDYLLARDERCIMCEFIDTGSPPHSVRAVVLGDKVVASYKNSSVDETDFRSNANQEQRNREIIELTDEQREAVSQAVFHFGIEFVAVDFVVRDDHPYILEVNAPFNFLPVVNELQIDVATQLVEHLQHKSAAIIGEEPTKEEVT